MKKFSKKDLTRFPTASLENLGEKSVENQGFAQFPQSFPQATCENSVDFCRLMWKKFLVKNAQNDLPENALKGGGGGIFDSLSS